MHGTGWVRFSRQYPRWKTGKTRAPAENLTAKNLQTEADYFNQPNRQSFMHLWLGLASETGRGAARLMMPDARQ